MLLSFTLGVLFVVSSLGQFMRWALVSKVKIKLPFAGMGIELASIAVPQNLLNIR